VEWEVAAASDSEPGLSFQPAKAINRKPCARSRRKRDEEDCCSCLGPKLPLLALAKIAGVKEGLQLALERPTKDCCSDLLVRLRRKGRVVLFNEEKTRSGRLLYCRSMWRRIEGCGC
jgi:hypothetical protein